MKRLIFLLISLICLGSMQKLTAQPKQEVRAAWVTAVYGLDWPRTRATSPQKIQQQKNELIEIFYSIFPYNATQELSSNNL